MSKEETNSGVSEMGSGTTTREVSTNKGAGGETMVLRTPACATAHIVHSWLGTPESSL
jgi:hypothetical protein